MAGAILRGRESRYGTVSKLEGEEDGLLSRKRDRKEGPSSDTEKKRKVCR